MQGFLLGLPDQLLDLGFLVSDMLACLGIEFHDLHLFRHRALVLGSGVKVTSASGRFQLDFVAAFTRSHGNSFSLLLDFFAASAHISQYGINTDLVDYAQTSIGKAQGNPAVLGFNEDAATLQVRQEATLGLVVGMGNVVADHRPFPGDLANTCHVVLLQEFPKLEKPRVYRKNRGDSITCAKQLCLDRFLNLTFVVHSLPWSEKE
jgi:hypothetical protein